jgi:serine O-acetyltransferase
VIESRADLRAYLEADRVALRVEHTLKNLMLDDVWRFERSLRRLEFRLNTGANPLLLAISKLRHRRLSRMLGFTIPPNVFGPGLSISHYGPIQVNSDCRIGARCRIHPGVMVGASHGADAGAPVIGDDCYLGSGAKLFGGIELGSGTIVGANAVVNRSFRDGNVTIAGVPARVIGDREALTLDAE